MVWVTRTHEHTVPWYLYPRLQVDLFWPLVFLGKHIWIMGSLKLWERVSCIFCVVPELHKSLDQADFHLWLPSLSTNSPFKMLLLLALTVLGRTIPSEPCSLFLFNDIHSRSLLAWISQIIILLYEKSDFSSWITGTWKEERKHIH